MIRFLIGRTFVCFKTIYRWLFAGLLVAGELNTYATNGNTWAVSLAPLSQRPKEIRKRELFGHRELDTVVSSRGMSKACAATFIERKTRMYVAIKMPDRTAHSIEIVFGVVATFI